MTAQEMFEELGYKYTRKCYSMYCDLIVYTNTYYVSKECKIEVSFDLTLKEYSVIENYRSALIDTKLHKAITKQIEELGWLDDNSN